MRRPINKKIRIFILALLFIVPTLSYATYHWASAQSPSATQKINKIFTVNELRQYNGEDPSKPIYLALDGFVYDVTAGKEFYQKGGSYHDLAGRDASQDLHLFGGGIIKRKYPIIGRLEK